MTHYAVCPVITQESTRYEIGHPWADRFLADLAVTYRDNTVRAYAFDLARWLNYCGDQALDPLHICPRDVLGFIEAERRRAPPLTDEHPGTAGTAQLSDRTINRRLSAIRQWYHYLGLYSEQTGLASNPVPMGRPLRTALGVRLRQPASLRYDRTLPQVLPVEVVARFLEHLTITRYRDKAIVYLMWHSGLRITEVLSLRLEDMDWGNRLLTVYSSKSRTTRRIPISQEAEQMLANYIRLERPPTLDHDRIFVCLGRRHHGRPLTYRAWVYICDQARRAAGLSQVHAHAFRHTCATNLAEGGMPLDALQKQLGHAHPDTTMIYNDIRSRRLVREYRAAMEKHDEKKTTS